MNPSPKGYIGLYDLSKTLEKFAIFLLPQIIANQSAIGNFLSANLHISAQVTAWLISCLVYIGQQFSKGSPIVTPEAVKEVAQVAETIIPQAAPVIETVAPIIEQSITPVTQ